MSNSTGQIPSGATHKTPKGTYMKCVMGNWFEWLHEWVEVGRRVSVERLTEIERQDAPTAADIDWSRQEVPAGATHYSPETDATHECFYKDNFKQMWVVKMPRIGWQDASPVSEHERPIAIPTKPEPQVDWSKAPEGATHYSKKYCQYYKVGNGVMLWDQDNWVTLIGFTASDFDKVEAIKRPESINDIARSIEAARIEEQASMPYPDGDERYFETSDVPETKKYPHYFKDVSAVDAIDLYHVARLYDITDPALFHAFKKIACAGKRGAKDQAQDVQEAIDALKRWQELNV